MGEDQEVPEVRNDPKGAIRVARLLLLVNENRQYLTI